MVKIAVLVTFFNGEISPFEQSALECALEFENAQITVVSMSPLSEKERLEYYTRFGVRAVIISDKIYAGSDTLTTSKILARYFNLEKFDVIMCGRQSLRGDTAQVPAELAVMLGYVFFPYVMGFSEGIIKTRLGDFELKFPCVISVERIKSLRFASVFSQKHSCEVVDNSILKINADEIGFKGSPTKVIATFKSQREQKKCEFIGWDEFDGVIKQCLERETAKTPVNMSAIEGEKFDEVFYCGKGVKKIAECIANKAVKLHYSDINIVEEIVRKKPKIVLFPADLRYRALAPQIAAKLNAGLCADCIKLEKSGENLIMYRPALGGDTIAKIVSESDIKLATVRVEGLSGEIVFGVGFGALKGLERIRTLAEKYGAELVASRKAVDSLNLDYSLQVGLTGKIITPKVYVAFGVSGAIQHIVGVENSNTIIAINSDRNAEIFKYSDFGIIKQI